MRNCPKCSEGVSLEMWAHDFLAHQMKGKAYTCTQCEHVDVVTQRFQQHLNIMHSSYVDDVEKFFRPVPQFTKLVVCPWPTCLFLTTDQTAMGHHLRTMHSAFGEELQRAGGITTDELRQAMGESTSNMCGENSRTAGTFRLPTCDGRKPVSRVKPTPSPTAPSLRHSSSEDTEDERERRMNPMVRTIRHAGPELEAARQNWTMLFESIAVPSPSRRMGDAARPTMRNTNRRTQAQTNADAVQLVREMNPPELLPRPRRTQLERMAAEKNQFRYITELNYGPGRLAYIFFYNLPPVTVKAAIVRRSGNNITQSTMRQYYSCLHAGDPARALNSGCLVPWRCRGPVFDTHTRPWCIVQVIAVSQAPVQGPSYVIIADSGDFFYAEVVVM